MNKLILIITTLGFMETHAQTCDSLVPTFLVDFTGVAAGTTWTSPDTLGAGYCCSASTPYRCINFILTTDSNTAAVTLSFLQPNPPIGTLTYQVDCGPVLMANGDTQVINTCGTHCVTTCKPGNRTITYMLSSILASNPSGCNAYSQCNNVTSVPELEGRPEFSLYPNPFHTTITVQSKVLNCQLYIYNNLGMLLRKEHITNHTTTLNRDALYDGIYFYQVVSEAGLVTSGYFIAQ